MQPKIPGLSKFTVSVLDHKMTIMAKNWDDAWEKFINEEATRRYLAKLQIKYKESK